MTAPSLLDELEGVVRLSNEADRLPYGEGRAYAYRDATAGGYVMVKRPRGMPFVLSLKQWAKIPKQGRRTPEQPE